MEFPGDLKLWFGQAKLLGNIQHVTSSQNLQLADRSLMNNQYNIDRDVGIQLHHTFNTGTARYNRAVYYSQGDGILYRGPSSGGDVTARVEALPFGSFTKKGDQYEGDLAREEKVKLILGATYDRTCTHSKTVVNGV